MAKRGKAALYAAALAAYAFLYVPLVIVVLFSFSASRLGTQWAGFTLGWYVMLLHDADMLHAAWNSLVIALAASLAAIVFGTLAALATHKYRLRFLPVLVLAPLSTPDILQGVSLLVFFVLLNVSLGLRSIMLAHTSFCIAYVAIVVSSRLAGMDPSLVEAARDLGASPWKGFWLVTLPLLVPGILAGGLLAFTMSIDDFVITFFTAGAGTSTLPLRIYTMIKVAVTPEVNAVSTLLMALTLVLVISISRLAPQALKGMG
ncbi:MAG: ABC transporter permease subunit [Betaproteobacteria bacterium]|nr:ABC transporter permease subunit [Betaproteobacteria bacterium]